MITSLMDLSSDSRHRLHFLSILTMALLLLASTPQQSHAQDDDLTLELIDQIGGFAGPAAAAFPFAFIQQDQLA